MSLNIGHFMTEFRLSNILKNSEQFSTSKQILVSLCEIWTHKLRDSSPLSLPLDQRDKMNSVANG